MAATANSTGDRVGEQGDVCRKRQKGFTKLDNMTNQQSKYVHDSDRDKGRSHSHWYVLLDINCQNRKENVPLSLDWVIHCNLNDASRFIILLLGVLELSFVFKSWFSWGCHEHGTMTHNEIRPTRTLRMQGGVQKCRTTFCLKICLVTKTIPNINLDNGDAGKDWEDPSTFFVF